MKLSVPHVSLVLACYNEAGLFDDSVSRIFEVLDGSGYRYELIFVDDASSDKTPALIKALSQKNKPVRAFYHSVNRGRGGTVAEGIRQATGKVVGYIDIDCEVSPVYIPQMVSLILRNRADVVIGRRHYRTSPRAIVREILSRGYQWVSNMLVGTGGLDTETGYKFFNRKKILPVLDKTKNTGWFWDTEIMVFSRRAKLRIVELPVLFLRRFDKKSSVNIVSDTIDYMVQLWRFRTSLKR